jgi:hypothetical protein
MDGHHPDAVGVQNSAYRFTRPKSFFPGLYVAKDRDEAQALTKGLSKEKTRERIASQRPQTSLLNQSPGY